MRILGIDPGIARTGYALIEQAKGSIRLVDCGCVTTMTGESEPKRLLEIKTDLDSLIKNLKPDALCVESIFFSTNVKTAISVAQARGVVLVAGAEHKLKIIEVTPLQVKIGVTGFGKADKNQVQRMIVSLLKLKKIPKPDDAVDAAAIAWAGLGRARFAK